MSTDLVYPFAERPREGAAVLVAPGLYWVRMPIPIPGLEHINLWLAEDGEGWTVIDTGVKTQLIRDLWTQVLETELNGRPITRVVCTHFHPDHMGLAGWFHERWGVLPWMTLGEWSFGRMMILDAEPQVPADVIDFHRRHGLAEAAIERIRVRGYNTMSKAIWPLPRGYRRLVDDETFDIGGREWRVIVGRGHSPEHASLFCAQLGVLISGDQILPRITPHIGVYATEPEGDPLSLYLDSLPRFRPLPADTLVLPAHGDPFRGLHDRLDALHRHHDVRLAQLDARLAEWTTATDTFPILFRRELALDSQFLALGEALAHLHHLMRQGRAVREIGPDGVYRYRRNGAAQAAA